MVNLSHFYPGKRLYDTPPPPPPLFDVADPLRKKRGRRGLVIRLYHHSPGILGNSTLSVLLMECGLFTSCSIKAAIAIMALVSCPQLHSNETRLVYM